MWLAVSKETGKKIAWITSGGPVEPLIAMDVIPVYPENHGAMIGASKMGVDLCEKAETMGYSKDICSYARADIACSTIDGGPIGGLPRPDFLVCCNNICGTVLKWYEVQARYYDVPIFIFDTPIMASYNYPSRFFISLMPFLAILAALFIEELQFFISKSKYNKYQLILPIAMGLILFFSFLRVISLKLLLENDPRIAAGQFIEILPKETKLEYTMYPPNIPNDHFKEEFSYPIFFTKFKNQEVPDVPLGKPYKKFNEGEAGLLNRKTDYLVVDSFTYTRCQNEAVYQTNPVECGFFEQLLAGNTSYNLIGDFSYSLPPFLPQISISFVNPDIQVFQKSE